MPVPSALSDLTATAASNSPSGSENVFPDLDNYLRAHAGFIAQLRDGTGQTAAALTIASLTVTGNAAIGGTLTVTGNAALLGNLTITGTPSLSSGIRLGYLGLPVASVVTGAFVAADKGKAVYATGNVTIPNSTMSSTDEVWIINTTASPITITAAIGTLRLAGTATTGDRTLAAYGVAHVIFTGGVTAHIYGEGLT